MPSASMTKIVDTECPGCKKKFGTAVDLNELEIAKGNFQHEHLAPPTPAPIVDVAAEVEKALAKRAPVKEEKKAGPKLPSYVKKYKCKDCGKLHENKEFEGLPKGRCDTCGSILTTRSKGKCPFCKDGEIEGLDDSDLEEMGLYWEDDEEDEHEGHNHE